MEQNIDRGAWIVMRIETTAAFGADAVPLAEQEGTAEQIGPNFHAVEAPLVPFGPDADQGGGFGEKRELDRGWPGRGSFAAFGHKLAGSISALAESYQRKGRKRASRGWWLIRY